MNVGTPTDRQDSVDLTINSATETATADFRAEGHRQRACQQASGEVFTEYGIIRLDLTFPMRSYDWTGEFPPDELTDDQLDRICETLDIDRQDLADGLANPVTEQYDVVPVQVVTRGLETRQMARNLAEHWNDRPQGSHQYRAVILSDTRGL